MSVETKLDLNNEKFCQSDGSLLTLSGDTRISSLGTLKYTTNQASNYDARSIPDVNYVSGLTNTISGRVTTIESLYVTGGTNGLNKVGKNIKLGGVLIENTTICGPYTLNICNSAKLNTQLGYQISGNTMFRTSNKTLSSLYIGYNTSSNGCGINNIGIGSCVLSATTIGFNNIGIGSRSLTKNDGGHNNIAIGVDTLSVEQNAIGNIAIGSSTLSQLSSGGGNIGLGYCVMSDCSVIGCENIGIGCSTLKNITNGCYNIGIGDDALLLNTTGVENISLGHSSLQTNVVGSYNLGFGYRSLYCNTGSCNIGIGSFSGYAKTTGDNNIFIGNCSGYNATGSNRLYVANSPTCNLILGDFTGNTITFPTVKICNTPNNGTVNDSVLVWNSTDKTIKKIGTSDLFTVSITGATNGLTTTGHLIKLGGTLTGDTTVNTNLNNLVFGGNYSKVTIVDKCPTASGCFKSEYTSTSGSTCISSLLTHSFGGVNLGVCNASSPFNNRTISIDWNGDMKIIDSVYSKGFVYNGDYSNNFTNESLVTKRYVTGLTVNAGMQCALNGLTKVGNSVILGGELTGDTKIYGCGIPFSLGCNTNYLGAYGLYADSVSQYTINDYLSCSVGNTLLTATGNLSLKGFNIFLNSLTKYDADYSSTYTNRSLVDKAYVTGLTSNITTNYVCSANNGLNKVGNNVRLGGALTGDTSITGAYTLGFNNTIINLTGSTSVNISGPTKLLNTPATGVSTDGVLVWNSTDKCIKTVNNITILSNAVTGSTNGLSKVGQNVKLGGVLCETTLVCGNNNDLLFGCNGSLINTYNVCSVTNTQCSTGLINIFTNSILNLKGSSINACSLINYDSDLSSLYTNRSLVDKAYVDSVATGLDVKTAVTVATTENIILSGLQTIDSVSLTAGMRVLVKNQTIEWKNGIYDASSTTWTRSSDYDFSLLSEINNGDLISVLSGTTNANSIWALTTPNPIVSGDTLTFTKFLQQTGVVSGNGISLANVGINKQISINLDTNSGLLFNGAALGVDWNKYRTGLCVNNYKVDLRVAKCVASGSEIPISINTGGTNTLYVDSTTINSCLGTPITTANNGLNKVGSNVRLGGALTGNTTISGVYTLGFNNSIINLTGSTCVNITGPTKLLTTPAMGAGIDNILVWNSTDKYVKQINPSSIISGLTNTYLKLDQTTPQTITASPIITTIGTGVNTDKILVWNSTDKVIKSIDGTNVLNSGITGGTNGLSSSGRKVKLGGVLTGDTSITGAFTLGMSNTFINITGSTCVSISGPTRLLTTPATGVGTDKILVWNSTDKIIKSVDSTVLNSGITGGTNGLTVTGRNLKLGGTLTGNTTISTSTNSMNFNGNGLYSVCTACISNCAGNGGSVYTSINQINSSISLLHCNTSLTQCSSINLSNGEIIETPSTNYCVNAGSRALIIGAVCSCLDLTSSIGTLKTVGTSVSSYFTTCSNGNAYIYGCNGVDITSPHINGISLCAAVRIPITPSDGVITDSVLMWNSTDKCIKKLPTSSFGDKNNIYSSVIIDTSTGLTNTSSYVILVNHTLPVTITLPASPTDGLVFKLKDVSTTGALTHNITIARNGKLIDRQANDALINTDTGAMELMYNSTLGSWFSLSFIN